MKKKRTAVTVLTVVSIVIVVFGVLFGAIFGGVGYIMKKAADSSQEEFAEFMEKGAIETEGVIIPSSGDGTTVQYYVEEEDTTYEASYSISHSKYPVGKHVTVYYSASDVSECMFPDLYAETYGLLNKIFLIIGAFIGGFFLLAGIILFIISRVLNKKTKEEPIYQ